MLPFARFTYLGFHMLFVLPPLFVLSVVTYPKIPRRSAERAGILIMAVLAIGYTTPWDNYLIQRGVWGYGADTVVMTLWHAPVGEYLFMLLQTVVAGLWFAHVAPAEPPDYRITDRGRVGGFAAGLAVGVAGWALLTTPATFYIGAILAWSGPVLAVQWAFGWPLLWRCRRLVAVGVLVPTTYFCVADRIALSMGIWELSTTYTTGLTVAGLPVEEGAFFLMTNTFMVQGLLLYLWLVRVWR